MKAAFIRIEPAGTRLGNWLFEYAAAKSAAHGGPVTFVVYSDADEAAIRKYAEMFPDVRYARMEAHRANFAGMKFETVRAYGEAVYLLGLFQDVKWLDRETVRSLYACPPRIERSLQAKYGDLLAKPNLVAVHVRRGDYLWQPHRHPFVGEGYLRAAVRKFAAPAVEYVVCSDDLAWCRQFFGREEFASRTFHFMDGNGVLEDFFIISKCAHAICSNSSFSWWGSYLRHLRQGGRTIFPSKWYGMAIKADWQGMYFDGCEVIENHYTFKAWLQAVFKTAKVRLGDLARKLHLRNTNATT